MPALDDENWIQLGLSDGRVMLIKSPLQLANTSEIDHQDIELIETAQTFDFNSV